MLDMTPPPHNNYQSHACRSHRCCCTWHAHLRLFWKLTGGAEVQKELHMLNPVECWVSAVERFSRTSTHRDLYSFPSVPLSSSYQISLSAALFPLILCVLGLKCVLLKRLLGHAGGLCVTQHSSNSVHRRFAASLQQNRKLHTWQDVKCPAVKYLK